MGLREAVPPAADLRGTGLREADLRDTGPREADLRDTGPRAGLRATGLLRAAGSALLRAASGRRAVR
jgi:hypothetical protein